MGNTKHPDTNMKANPLNHSAVAEYSELKTMFPSKNGIMVHSDDNDIMAPKIEKVTKNINSNLYLVF